MAEKFSYSTGQHMHLAQRLATVVLTLGLTAGLAGCDFHLKGTNPTATPLVYTKLNLVLPKGVEDTDDLQRKLSVYLTASGVQLSNANDAYVLRILDYKPIRHELKGTLIEVILRVSVTFQIEDQQGNPVTQPRTLNASRSYQYDIATVNTDDQQNKYLRGVLVDDIAQQITRQIAANRLPKAKISTNTQSETKTNTP
jgi:LPS-assembly lipoprotein